MVQPRDYVRFRNGGAVRVKRLIGTDDELRQELVGQ